MTTTTRRPFELPRLQLLPIAEQVTSAVPAAADAPRPMAAPTRIPVPTFVAAPTPEFVPAPVQPPVAIAPVTPTVHVPVVVPTRPLHRRNGALGLTIGIVLLTLVFAAALAAQRTMHGWPPGAH